MDTQQNPFSNYGRIVSGDFFIGRKLYLRTFENRIVSPNDPNNLALVGYPRIGKSSLVDESIVQISAELIKNKKIPIWVNLATFLDSNSFFRYLVIKAYEYFEENELLTPLMIKSYNIISNEAITWITLKNEIERFFQKVNTLGFRFIYILDEFDYARILFKNNYVAFQGLRELGYRGSIKVTFITTSRRSIKDTEIQCAANSVLDLIFKKEYISMYNEKDLEIYYRLFENNNILLNEAMKSKIDFYCGYHPYLLAVLGFEIFNSANDKIDLDVDKIFQNVQISFVDYYNQLIDLLKEDNTYTKLLQIVFGPVIDVKYYDFDELLQYGLIRKGSEFFESFSSHFQGFLKLKVQDEKIEIDTWILLQKAEVGLRHLVLNTLFLKFGPEWQDNYLNSYTHIASKKSKLEEIFLRLNSLHERDLKQYGFLARNISILDQTYIHQIFDYFILFSWDDLFSSIFNKNKNYWKEVRDSLEKVRNPFAHHKVSILPDWEISRAEEYCKEIIEITNIEF